MNGERRAAATAEAGDGDDPMVTVVRVSGDSGSWEPVASHMRSSEYLEEMRRMGPHIVFRGALRQVQVRAVRYEVAEVGK